MKKYLIALALVLALIGTPVLAAQDNTALINSLMQQVEQLMMVLRTLLAQQTGQNSSSANLSDTLIVTKPEANQTIELPSKIIGKAKNVFEGWGNAQLFDSNGQKLDEVFIMPGGDNGCDYGVGYCPFSVSIGKPWSVSPTSQTGYILFTESEAKGDTPKSFKLPVKLNVGIQNQQVKVFYVAPNDNGLSGKKIGCGDSIVPLTREISKTSAPLTKAIELLLSDKRQNIGESGLTNSLYKSNLLINRISISNGLAQIYLSGTLLVGGTCDDPRIIAQIKETALQFSGVNQVKFYVNGREYTGDLRG